MNKQFQPIKLLEKIAKTDKTGHLQITANQVTWDLYFKKGLLQYGCHSLQSLETIQHYLLCLNQEEIAKTIPTLAQTTSENDQLIPTILKQLGQQNYLTPNDLSILTTNLIQDALEFCLWLQEGQCHWHNGDQTQSFQNATSTGANFLAISTLLKNFLMRMKTWQTFSDVITSPYQRLFCADLSLIQKPVPSGKLNPTSLQKLVKLMQGKTLRQISVFLKQDELNVAQLLFPYVQNNILQLQPPQSPLNQLPSIPSSTAIAATNNQKIISSPINNNQPTQTKQQKTYKIVCIDDSPTILDMIKAYLKGDQYEVLTVENPTKSLSSLFKYKPDLILVDFSMPGINGNKLCRIIKSSSLFKNVPMIMISGNTKMLTPENIEEAGATDYLAKPFTKEDLEGIINKYLQINTNSNQQESKTVTNTDSTLLPADKRSDDSPQKPLKNTQSQQDIAEQSSIRLSDNLTQKPLKNTQIHQDVTKQSSVELSDDSTRKPIKIIQTDKDIDPVTQLPNRQCFDRYLSDVLQSTQQTQSSCHLILITVDNFAEIQATLGKSIGNKILQNVAKNIQSWVRANDIIARWSDNEFVIYLSKVNHPKILEKIGQRILNSIKQTPDLLEYELTLELSHSLKIHSLDKVKLISTKA
ncbi:MAG: diguanylate cyclase [Crocosphaera sp.]|nr:diguanylate cyclase [Crocosphaera sp.]